MALPKLSTPTYTLTVPSTKQKVKYRPYLVKEEKIMMLVKESTDEQEILDAMKDLISACTFNKVDPNAIAVFDIEYMFLQLRAKSVGEIIEQDMKCLNVVDEKECGGLIRFEIDISDIKVTYNKDHSNKVMLSDDIGITIKYPSVDNMVGAEERNNADILVDLIENIFDKDNVYDAKDTKREELEEFIDNITNKQFMKIRKVFFDTMPVLNHEVNYVCSKCGNKGNYTLSGLSDFF